MAGSLDDLRKKRQLKLAETQDRISSAIQGGNRIGENRQARTSLVSSILRADDLAERPQIAAAAMPNAAGHDHSHASGGIPTGPQGGPNPQFIKALQKLIAASGGKITVMGGNWGYRDPERQKQLWEQALAKYGDPEIADNWVARPGGSRHEFGIAADLQFADEATRKWAHQKAKEFGLYFPMSHEPWHIELVGSR